MGRTRNYELRARFSVDTDTTGVEQLEARLKTLEKRLDRLDGKEVDVRFNEKYTQQLDDANKMTENINKTPIGPKKANTKAFDKIEDRYQRLRKLNKILLDQMQNLRPGSDPGANARAQELGRQAERARREAGDLKYEAKLLGADKVSRGLSQMEGGFRRTREQADLVNRSFAEADKQFEETTKSAAAFAKQLKTINNIGDELMRVRVEFEGDDTEFEKTLAAVKTRGRALEAQAFKAYIDAKLRGDDAMVREAKEAHSRVQQELSEVVLLHTRLQGDRQVKEGLDDIRRRASDITTRPWEMELMGDNTEAVHAIREAANLARREASKAYSIRVKAEVLGMTELAADAERIRREMISLANQRANLAVELKNVPRVLQGLVSVKRAAEGVEGTYEIKLDYDKVREAIRPMNLLRSTVGALGAALNNTGGGMSGFSRRVQVVQQAVFAFTAALVAVAVAAAGPLLASLTIGATAMVAFAAGIGLVLAAAAPLISQLGKQKQLTDQVKTAEEGVQGAIEGHANAVRSLNEAHRNVADVQRGNNEAIRDSIKAHQDAIRGVQDARRQYNAALRGQQETERQGEESIRDAILARQDAMRAVADARRNLSQAEIDAERAVADSMRGVADARRNLVQAEIDAQRQLQDAMRGVADARRNLVQTEIDAQRQLQDAIRAVGDARRNVADTARAGEESVRQAVMSHNDALRAQQQAIQGVLDARRNLQQATQDLADAQMELVRAQQDEIMNLRALGFDVAGTRLDQRQVILDIQEAQEALNAAMASGNGRDIEQARINLERARLRQRQLADQATVAERELSEAQREGTDNLQGAREQYNAALQQRADALRGVRDAEAARAEADRGVGEAARAVEIARYDAARANQDAQRDLQTAYSDVNRTREEGNRAVADAQRDLADAQRNLSETRQDGIKSVADAQRDLADANRTLAEARQDGLKSVADAQRGLNDTIRDEKEAIREIGIARLQARLDNQDAARDVKEAYRGIKDAVRDAAEAERQIGLTRAQAARDMANALRGVAQAERAVKKALDELKTAQSGLNTLIGQLSPKVQNLAAHASSVWNNWKTQTTLAENVLISMLHRLLNVANEAMPYFATAANNTAIGVDLAFQKIHDNFRNHGVINSWKTILDSIPFIVHQWTVAFGSFFGGFSNIMGVAMPFVREFSTHIRNVAQRFLEWTNSEAGRQRLMEFFQSAKPVVSTIAYWVWKIGSDILNWSIDHPYAVAGAIDFLGGVLWVAWGAIKLVITALAGIGQVPGIGAVAKAVLGIWLAAKLIPGPIKFAIFWLGRMAAAWGISAIAASVAARGMMGTFALGGPWAIAIAAAAYYLYSLFKSSYQMVVDFTVPTVNGIMQMWRQGSISTGEMVMALFRTLLASLASFAATMLTMPIKIASDLMAKLPGPVGRLGKQMQSQYDGIMTGLRDNIAGKTAQAALKMEQNMKEGADKSAAQVEGFKVGSDTDFAEFQRQVEAETRKAKEAATTNTEGLKNGGLGNLDQFKNQGSGIMDQLKNNSNARMGEMKGGGVGATGGMRDSVNAILASLRDSVNQLTMAMKQNSTIQMNAMRAEAGAAVGGMRSDTEGQLGPSFAARMGQLAGDATRGFINGLTSGDLLNLVIEAGRRLADALPESVRKALEMGSPSRVMEGEGNNSGQGFINGLDAMNAKVGETGRVLATSLVGGVRMAIDSLNKLQVEFHQTGQAMVEGLAQGAQRAQAIVVAAMQRIAKAAMDAARAELQVQSPSRITTWMGEMVGQGFVNGVNKMRESVQSAMRSLVESNHANSAQERMVQTFKDAGQRIREALTGSVRDAYTDIGNMQAPSNGITIQELEKRKLEAQRAYADASHKARLAVLRGDRATAEAIMREGRERYNRSIADLGRAYQARSVGATPTASRATQQASSTAMSHLTARSAAAPLTGGFQQRGNNKDVVDAIADMKHYLARKIEEEFKEVELGNKSLETMYNAGFHTAISAIKSRMGADAIDEALGGKLEFDKTLKGK